MAGERDTHGQPDGRGRFRLLQRFEINSGTPGQGFDEDSQQRQTEEEKEEAETDGQQAGSEPRPVPAWHVSISCSRSIRLAGRNFKRLAVLVTIGRPPLQQVDTEQQDEGQAEHGRPPARWRRAHRIAPA